MGETESLHGSLDSIVAEHLSVANVRCYVKAEISRRRVHGKVKNAHSYLEARLVEVKMYKTVISAVLETNYFISCLFIRSQRVSCFSCV